MKNIIVVLAIGLLSGVSALSQGSVTFDMNFGANPPPHTPGNPASGAILTSDLFYAIVYLDTTAPISASIGEMDDGTFTPVFQFTDLVYASYSGGGPGFDYENSWQLTDAQAQDLLAGQWYAEVTYSDATYIGQITPVPEPSSAPLLLAGLAAVSACWHRRSARIADI
jgi:hypothetical protein